MRTVARRLLMRAVVTQMRREVTRECHLTELAERIRSDRAMREALRDGELWAPGAGIIRCPPARTGILSGPTVAMRCEGGELTAEALNRAARAVGATARAKPAFEDMAGWEPRP